MDSTSGFPFRDGCCAIPTLPFKLGVDLVVATFASSVYVLEKEKATIKEWFGSFYTAM
jgi:hypothetical protein